MSLMEQLIARIHMEEHAWGLVNCRYLYDWPFCIHLQIVMHNETKAFMPSQSWSIPIYLQHVYSALKIPYVFLTVTIYITGADTCLVEIACTDW